MDLKSIEQLAKNLYLDARILLKFGSFHPTAVQLPGTETTLHVNPHDRRVRRVILGNWCVRKHYPRNQRFWKFLVENCQPTTAVDVGLNYGECIFGAQYSSETKVFGFDGNLKLKPHVAETRQLHPNRNQIEIVFKLANDRISEANEFFVHRDWSGGSTAAPVESTIHSSKFQKTTVASTTIDHVLSDRVADLKSVVFKIDVEGYEARVLKGMKQTLNAAQSSVGFIEFSPAMLRRAGDDVDLFWEFLQSRFQVSAFRRDDVLFDFAEKSLEELRAFCGKSFHTDLLLIEKANSSAIADFNRLQSDWNEHVAAKSAA